MHTAPSQTPFGHLQMFDKHDMLLKHWNDAEQAWFTATFDKQD